MIRGDLQVIIDGRPPVTGELTRTREVERVPTHGTMPDPAWSHVDATGHFHAYRFPVLDTPTLVRRDRHMPCSGEHPGFAALGVTEPEHTAPCDGYDEPEYFCHLCDAQVEPGRIPQHTVDVVKGERWELEMAGHVDAGVQVSVLLLMNAGAEQWFGFATRVSQNAGCGSAGSWVRTRLVGTGPLAQRPAVTARPRASF